MKTKVRILLADDHKLLRAGLKLLLQGRKDLEVVAEAEDGIQTLELFDAFHPDLVLLDLSMPGLNGLDCLKEIKSRNLKTKVLVLTMHEDENHIRLVMQAGAAGYIKKSAADIELFTAIDTVLRNKIYLSSQDSDMLLQNLLQKEEPKADPRAPYTILSPREREVLRYMVRGYSMTEIGEKLKLSIKTVDTYKVRLMEKLEFTKKSELVTYALKYGLLKDSDVKAGK
ncbi:MAG: response regulator transcription factor [Acidaminococcaceae bacterium]|jgi:DNA-binding NarL/FixJ family response regulator|nr:response regulator transcription factor [Acidaminococcaceae bacterium]MCI2109606.1 response regulator transcription factor [Acidaminococcaceae bacterium]